MATIWYWKLSEKEEEEEKKTLVSISDAVSYIVTSTILFPD